MKARVDYEFTRALKPQTPKVFRLVGLVSDKAVGGSRSNTMGNKAQKPPAQIFRLVGLVSGKAVGESGSNTMGTRAL